jgi:hypothetical protein
MAESEGYFIGLAIKLSAAIILINAATLDLEPIAQSWRLDK